MLHPLQWALLYSYTRPGLNNYLCYYPHRSRDSVSPVCGIFLSNLLKNQVLNYVAKRVNLDQKKSSKNPLCTRSWLRKIPLKNLICNNFPRSPIESFFKMSLLGSEVYFLIQILISCGFSPLLELLTDVKDLSEISWNGIMLISFPFGYNCVSERWAEK